MTYVCPECLSAAPDHDCERSTARPFHPRDGLPLSEAVDLIVREHGDTLRALSDK